MTTAHYPPWRVGRSVGRTIYDRNDHLIGLMDSPDLAAAVVAAVNIRYLGGVVINGAADPV